MKRGIRIAAIVVAIVVLVVLAGAGVLFFHSSDLSADKVANATVRAADAPHPDAASIARGHAVAIAADCGACHTQPGHALFAGGYALNTPFGTIVSSNITPERTTGIGNWTERDFFNAVRHGRTPHGLLYPAMPYTDYVQISDQDMHDLWAYVRSVTPVRADTGGTHLKFPFNIRELVAGWNMLFFHNHPFKPQPDKSADWNRGHYLVDALGHCGICHTPKNSLGAAKEGAYLQGAVLQNWYAPELSGDKAYGLGSWNSDDVKAYLKIGSNRHAVAAGTMAEVIENSTQYMPDADLAAIHTYLASLPGSGKKPGPALAATDPAMKRGAHIYVTACAACHSMDGEGINEMATHIADSAEVRAPDATSLIHVLMLGQRAAVTKANETGAQMPSFSWKLTDSDAAAVLTYIRNSWGNAAPAVTAEQIGKMRHALKAPEPMAVP